MPHLHGVALQEVAAGGHIEKKVFHKDGGSFFAGDITLALYFRALDDDGCAYFFVLGSRAHLYLCHRCDRCERLAPETHRPDGKQVFGRTYLARCVALKTHAGVRFGHARAVVHHLYQALAGVFHDERDLGGFGVDGIFYEFLDHRSGPLHHLAGRDLVGDGFGE